LPRNAFSSKPESPADEVEKEEREGGGDREIEDSWTWEGGDNPTLQTLLATLKKEPPGLVRSPDLLLALQSIPVPLRLIKSYWIWRKEKEEGTEKLKILGREREGIIPLFRLS
jgi:hypothetical protein